MQIMRWTLAKKWFWKLAKCRTLIVAFCKHRMVFKCSKSWFGAVRNLFFFWELLQNKMLLHLYISEYLRGNNNSKPSFLHALNRNSHLTYVVIHVRVRVPPSAYDIISSIVRLRSRLRTVIIIFITIIIMAIPVTGYI